MNDSPARSRWPLLLAGAVCLVAIGIAIGYSLREPGSGIGDPGSDAHTVRIAPNPEHGTAHADPGSRIPDPGEEIAVTLTPEMTARAGIRTVTAAAGTATTRLRIPAVVQPNAYREVVVTSLVSGRVTQVHAELGQRVNAQDPLATVYSPELADAQTDFIAARAEQAAHAQRQTRTQRLTAIGAASREELEMIEAERARHDAMVEIARARLTLLGIPEERTQRLTGPQDVITTMPVRAPFAGVVTRRAANIGLNIDPSTPLFTIIDLSTVWVIADLFERDFARVRVGSPAAITSGAYPGLALRGRVSYIDPQVQQETRTAKLRVEVPNAGGQLRLGMYVDVEVGEASERHGVFVPKSAVQIVGSDSVVYLADESRQGRFVERKVKVGDSTGDRVLVVAGLQPGDEVVTDGVFFVRAERERQVVGSRQ
ncbi:MAG: efflux RND transporter periplasmic adaptor subunit [Acidobacteria bacterium]|nr:efflux RND transporter periplasmic adaptor subunit [Acidobacteriota bacterium]